MSRVSIAWPPTRWQLKDQSPIALGTVQAGGGPARLTKTGVGRRPGGTFREPLLYLSLYLKQHRQQYYDLLTRVRTEGDWETWVGFFADGVTESATGAVTTAQRLTTLARDDRTRIERDTGRLAGTMLRLHQSLLEHPIQSATQLAARTSVSMPAVNKGLAALEKMGTVQEITGRRRRRIFSYSRYLHILSEGTEPL